MFGVLLFVILTSQGSLGDDIDCETYSGRTCREYAPASENDMRDRPEGFFNAEQLKIRCPAMKRYYECEKDASNKCSILDEIPSRHLMTINDVNHAIDFNNQLCDEESELHQTLIENRNCLNEHYAHLEFDCSWGVGDAAIRGYRRFRNAKGDTDVPNSHLECAGAIAQRICLSEGYPWFCGEGVSDAIEAYARIGAHSPYCERLDDAILKEMEDYVKGTEFIKPIHRHVF